jgi:hypothetical protein
MAAGNYGIDTLKECKFKWDIVPFPVGPDNKKGVVPGTAYCNGITMGAKNPVGAAAYIYYLEKYNMSNYDKNILKNILTKDCLNRYKAASKNTLPMLSWGIGNWWNVQWPFWGDIFAGKSVASTCTKYAPVFQKEIDITLADTKLPNIKPFKGAPVIDFEGGKLEGVSTANSYGIVSAAVTNDAAEVISGKSSMKIDIKNDAGWVGLFNSDPSVVQLPPFHTYKVSFDYKALGDTGTGGYYYIRLVPKANVADSAVTYGWTTLGPLKAGDTGKYEGDITVDKDTPDNCIQVGGYNVGSIVIDNIKVVEK